jgi:putative ABC transport system permease protein
VSAFMPWRRNVRREIDDELRFHFDARIAELISHGKSTDDARAQAMEEFGDVDDVRADLNAIDERVVAQQKRADVFESLWYDVRYAARSLWRTPAVSITIIVTLALGLGVNAAMFSLLDVVLFRPPAGVEDPDGVKRVWSLVRFRSGPQYWSGYDYLEYGSLAQGLASRSDIALYTHPAGYPLGRGEEPPTVQVAGATASMFRLLGIRPTQGRIYSPDEEVPTASAPVVVISDRFWKREFNRDPEVVGKVVEFSSKPYTVIGVTPPGFSGVELDETEAWVPLGSNPEFSPKTQATWATNPNINGFQVLVRGQDAVSDAQLEQLATMALRAPRPGSPVDTTTVAKLGSIVRAQGPGRVDTAQQVAERASIVAILVLVIAFANVVNLLLARAVRRRREIAVRLALGSSSGRLLRLLVSESVQLAALAAVAALAAAWWGGSLLRTLLMPEVQWAESPLHWRVLMLGVGAALVAGIIAGIIPALQSRAPDLTRSLKTGTREGGATRSRLRGFLVATQAALTVVLLVGATLFVQCLHNVKARDIGLTVDRLAFASVSQGNDPARRAEISQRLLAMEDRFKSVPGVERVAYTSMRPKWGIQFTSFFAEGIEGEKSSFYNQVSPGFFAASGTKILRGRDFAGSSAEQTVLINQTMADSLWPNAEPLGKCLHFQKADAPCYVIIGVTQTALVLGLKDRPEPHVYVPLSNPPVAAGGVGDVVLRMDPNRLTSSLATIREMLKVEFPAAKVSTNTLAASMEPEYRPWQLGATLFTLFGILAAIVAGIGVYSSVSYAVSQRTHEFGVRVALGATWKRIVREVVGGGLRTVFVGVVAGVLLALASGRLIASLMYGVSPYDPLSMLIASALLIGAATLACLMPAWRAGRSDPVTALRSD